ncbi:DNA-binding response regulator [Chryseotalea sanaruensis]|uniref:DNA-binding response regulator n=1 Tax=Chryseotalea sanaruensis TaxID=2482724 RepID=A0A401UCX2_9BACT|nr:response regulator transcription factor [Chryseotalea sanaruensis]GCC52736.1 DNA-binding response regulator [Chryseotalea sanaruensis]
MKILIIEDEKQLVKSMAQFLRQESYVCEVAYTASEANEKILLFDYDCILLDISLPDGNGLKILEKLRENHKADGVIMITAKGSFDDRIAGLNLGADDYLPKPFYLPELSARISAVIRRKRFDGNNKISFHEIEVDLLGKTVSVSGKGIELTRKEYDLLIFLIANKNRVVSKNAIAEHLSGDDAELMDKFDFIYSHIKNLKKKLTESGCEDYIKTIYGLGYKFTA